jgi:hypothetical protein
MKKRNNQFWKAFINPFIFGIYPLLSLTAKNSVEIHISDGYRALIFCLGGTALLTLLLLWVYRDWQRASLVSTGILFLFFSYGHIIFSLQGINPNLGNHLYGIIAVIVIFSLLVWIAKSSNRNWDSAINTLTVIGLVALILPTYKIISIELSAARFRQEYISPEINITASRSLHPQYNPDIYYIILDAYGRDDTLRDFLGLDNSEFLNSISDMGFTIGQCSRSNYSLTRLSLSSSLNMNYLDDIIDINRNDDGNAIALGHIIKNSLVRQTLEELGYQTIAFETGFVWTQIENADYYFSLANSHADISPFTQKQNKLEALLLQTSFLSSLNSFSDFLPPYLIPDLNQHEDLHRDQVLLVFDQLEGIPHMPGNKFVFAHIVSPHYPFVFAQDGSDAVNTSNEAQAYSDQLLYINARVINMIQKIIATSKEPPIIILQSDHGPQVENATEEVKILNAYYLPKIDQDVLFDNISPVNTFRVISNAYFGTEYPLLDNISFASSTHTPYDFIVVQEDRPGCILNPSP